MPEGPFGDHTGFYTPVEPFPVLHIEAMTMQREPIYHSIVTSQPPQEDHGLGKATERIFAPLLRFMIPDIVDYDLPAEGVFHNCAIVSIRKRYPKHAQKVMNAIWGAHMMSLTKLIIVVDEDCDVHDYSEVAFRAFGNVDYSRDLLLTEARSTTWTLVVPAVLGRQGGRRRDPEAADRGLHPGLAGEHGHVPGDRAEGRPALEGVRAVTDTVARPNPVKGFLRLVMIEHSIFALPFAYLAALTAMRSVSEHVQWGVLGLITIAMVSARTVAMAANRIIDVRIDAQNPRTANRELVTGAISMRVAWAGLLISLVIFFVAAGSSTPSVCSCRHWRSSRW